MSDLRADFEKTKAVINEFKEYCSNDNEVIGAMAYRIRMQNEEIEQLKKKLKEKK